MSSRTIIRNAKQMFNDWHKNSRHPQGRKPNWDIQPESIKAGFYLWAQMDHSPREGFYSFAQAKRNWQPYVSVSEKLDWKDFRMSVCRTHTWYDNDEDLTKVIGSFEAWKDQEVYCIKDYKPSGYLNTKDNIFSYKVVKIDGMSSKTYTFHEYDKALEYSRTCYIEDSKCNYVVFEIYLVNKLVYTISARRKQPVSIIKIDKEDDPKEEPTAKTNLHLITGGMDGVQHWLEGLPEGTVFQCIRKGDEFICLQFHVKMRWKKSCWLMSNFPEQQVGNLIAHYENFSKKHTLLEVQKFGKEWIMENDNGAG